MFYEASFSLGGVMLIKTSKTKSIFLDNKNVIRMVKIVDDKDKFLGRSLKGLIKEHKKLKLERINNQTKEYRSPKEIRQLVKELKKAVECVRTNDDRLGNILDDFISENLIDMKLKTEQAEEWEKWFYDLK